MFYSSDAGWLRLEHHCRSHWRVWRSGMRFKTACHGRILVYGWVCQVSLGKFLWQKAASESRKKILRKTQEQYWFAALKILQVLSTCEASLPFFPSLHAWIFESSCERCIITPHENVVRV